MSWREEQDYYSCKNCAKYKGDWRGDCGHHYTHFNQKLRKFETNYEIPSESMFDNVIGSCPSCWEPNQVLVEQKKAERIAQLINNYSLEELEQAVYLKYSQKKGGKEYV